MFLVTLPIFGAVRSRPSHARLLTVAFLADVPTTGARVLTSCPGAAPYCAILSLSELRLCPACVPPIEALRPPAVSSASPAMHHTKFVALRVRSCLSRCFSVGYAKIFSDLPSPSGSSARTRCLAPYQAAGLPASTLHSNMRCTEGPSLVLSLSIACLLSARDRRLETLGRQHATLQTGEKGVGTNQQSKVLLEWYAAAFEASHHEFKSQVMRAFLFIICSLSAAPAQHYFAP
jgi:hypothetical protein